MRVRKQDADGDAEFGQGAASYYVAVQGNDLTDQQRTVNALAVGQLVQTRLLMWQGECFMDTGAGMPWADRVDGFGNDALSRDQAIQECILGTIGMVAGVLRPLVTSIDDYVSTLDSEERTLAVTCTLNTVYGPVPFSFPVPITSR